MKTEPCEACQGTGKQTKRWGVTREMAIKAGCPQTEGDVIYWSERCDVCDGDGVVESEE